MRHLFLHCGLPKTGTTYLQKLFLRNRARLEEAGLGFGPYMDHKTGSHYPAFVEAVEQKGAAAVMAEIEACPADRILVSSEDLAHFFAVPAPGSAPGSASGTQTWGAEIRDAAAGRFTVTVIVYLRRQDFLKESIFSQVVKDWYCGSIEAYDRYDFDLNAKLLGLEAVFGQARVRPVLYDDLHHTDIVTPLLETLGLGITLKDLTSVGRENSGMPRRKVLFLAGLPKPVADGPGHRRGFPARFITRVLASSDSIAKDGERFLMSPAARYALVVAHIEGNRALVARHGIAHPGSFVTLPDPRTTWAAPEPITGREIAAVWQEALRTSFRRRNPLRGAWIAARVSKPLAAMVWTHRAARPEPTPREAEAF